MNDEWEEVSKDMEVFTVTNKDTLINHNIRLLSTKEGYPRLFFADLETPVCADGECRLAKIKIYWNLLGNYVGYGIDPDEPLTKFEHDPFDKEDYAKLHALLLDDNSVLRNREMSELVDEVPVSISKADFGAVDGISSATKKEIKESVVQGGLYSCYTLWHLVHGEVKKNISAYLQSIYTDSLNNYLLYSDYEDYQYYGLKKLPKEAFEKHFEQVIRIFEKTQPLIRTYILKKIPNNILEDRNNTEQFYRLFSRTDINTKTQLVKKAGSAHLIALEILSGFSSEMTKNQLKLYLEIFNENPENLTPLIKSNLLEAARSEKYAYNYLIKEFLNNKE
ncbi:hypothetical protein [Splendidivirga corallicola]